MPASSAEELGDQMTPNSFSRWGAFRPYDEITPSTPYEACVFIDNAILHLRNRYGIIAQDAFEILNGAHNAINDSLWEVA